MTIDKINKAKHYNNHPSGIECKYVMREFRSVDVAMATKYAWRKGYNDSGKGALTDMRQCLFWINEAITNHNDSVLISFWRSVMRGYPLKFKHNLDFMAYVMAYEFAYAYCNYDCLIYELCMYNTTNDHAYLQTAKCKCLNIIKELEASTLNTTVNERSHDYIEQVLEKVEIQKEQFKKDLNKFVNNHKALKNDKI